MSSSWTAFVPGRIVGKQRARTWYDERVKRVASKTPARTAAYERHLAACVRTQLPPSWPLDRAYKVYVVAMLSTVKSGPRKGLTRKLDADNIGKAVLDALNGIAWADDDQVTDLRVRKEPAIGEESVTVWVGALPCP